MDDRAALIRAARRLNRGAPPALYLFTDPARLPDPLAAAARLPRGAAIVYRHFGAPGRIEMAEALAKLARRRGLKLLIGEDEALAALVGADGVHLPERSAYRAVQLRARHPRWLITAAAHSARALRRVRGADAVVLAPVFPSNSPSAVRPLGLMRAMRLAALSPLPVIALGGVNGRTARMLSPRAFAGVAAVEALR